MAPYRRAGKIWFFAALVSAVLIASSAGAGQDRARHTVERFHAALISVMREADSLGYQGRFARLAPVVRETFNLSYMARFSSGYRWKKASTDRQNKLVAAFANMTIANYASRFDGFSGEAFETLGVRKGPRGALIVETQIVQSDGEKVTFDYVLSAFAGEWRVVDIFLKGTYSELAVRRSEYTSVIKRSGFDGLIAAIERKTASIEKKARAP